MPCRTEYNQDLALLSMQVHASAQSKKCQKTRVRLPHLRDSAARSLSHSNQPPRRLGSAVDMLHDTLPPIRPPPFPPKGRRFRGTGPGRERCVLTCSGAAGHINVNADTPYILISGRCGGGPLFEDQACYGTDKIHFVAVCPHTAHSGVFPKPLVLCWF
jgi:hypothetical protein